MTTDTTPSRDGARARREPWPWIVAGLLATMIASSMLLLAIAIRHADVAVDDDAAAGRVRAQALVPPGRLAVTAPETGR